MKKTLSVLFAFIFMVSSTSILFASEAKKAATAGGKEKIGILMVAHGEPETFDAPVWEKGLKLMFKEFKDSGMEVPTDEAFPTILEEIKHKYEVMGGKSRHAEMSRLQCKLVSQKMPGYDFRLGFMEFMGPEFSEVAEGMIKDGIKKIVFLHMLQTDSTHTGEINNKIKEMKLEDRGIKYAISKPLFYRPEPTQLVIDKILKATGNTPYEQVGVVLASHGEPEAWVKANLLNTKCKEQEIAFCNCVKKGLIERGFVWENITQGFNEFQKPEMPEAVELMAERKAKKVVVIPSFGTTEGMHITYDIPTKARTALVDPSIELVYTGGWNDNPLLIKAWVELAKEALKRL
jgi:protoheme ferro-lyase